MDKNQLFFNKGILYIVINLILFFMIGIEIIALTNIQYINGKITSSIEVKVAISESTPEGQLKEIERIIKEKEGVSSFRFISKEEGLNEVLHVLNAESLSTETLMASNPLHHLIKVQVDDPGVINTIIKDVGKNENVVGVLYGEQPIKKWMKYLKYIQPTLVLILCITLLLSIFVISRWYSNVNTIQKEQLAIDSMQVKPTFYLWQGFKIFVPVVLFASFAIVICYTIFFDFYKENVSLSLLMPSTPYPFSIWLVVLLIAIGLMSSITGWGFFIKSAKNSPTIH